MVLKRADEVLATLHQQSPTSTRYEDILNEFATKLHYSRFHPTTLLYMDSPYKWFHMHYELPGHI